MFESDVICRHCMLLTLEPRSAILDQCSQDGNDPLLSMNTAILELFAYTSRCFCWSRGLQVDRFDEFRDTV